MERVTDANGNVLEVFENDIDTWLTDYKERQGIEDYRTAPQSVWNGALRHVYKHVFKPNKQLLKSNINILNNNNIMDSTYNMYNYDLLMCIADYYIYDMCMVNNKEISIIGFETLTGISQEVIYNWGRDGERLSTKGSEILQKLQRMREESLSNRLVDGKQNPVGTIAVLNRQFGWNSPFTSDANRNKQALNANQLPRLDANPQIVHTIADNSSGQMD